MEYPKRKHPRLKEFDYSENGCYFVTVCTKNRANVLSTVAVGRGALTPPSVRLSAWGRVAEKYILNIQNVYPHILVEKFVIMPNHIHLLLTISNPANGGVRAPRPTSLSEIVRGFKSLTTREIGKPIWQTSFYDHVVRTDRDDLQVWQYINNNPAKWAEDEYYQQ